MKILIGADAVPTKENYPAFAAGDTETIVGAELTDLLKSADYRVFNLEMPLTSENRPIDKNGPALCAPGETVAGYETLGTDLLTLANNHILDRGEAGLKETMDLLKAKNISFLGAGENVDRAGEPFYVTVDGVKIGFFACAENEFSCATADSTGANPYDPLVSFDIVAAMKEHCDRIIVLYHGGIEHYRYPSPMLQRVCRKFADAGADLIVCQHSHCVGCMEEYRERKIIYGQGNFIFAGQSDECWKTGLLLQIGDAFRLDFIPVVGTAQGTRLADEEEAKAILDGFYLRSEEIKSRDFIETKYRKVACWRAYFYAPALLGKDRGPFVGALNKLTNGRFSKFLVDRLPKKVLLQWKNHIKTEAHRELLLAGLDELLRKK